MSSSVLNEARWDDNVRQWNASGGPRYSTSIASVQSGHEQRARNWIQSRGMWNVGDRNVSMEKYQRLLSFFHRVGGRHLGFRVRDWTDFRDDGRGVLGNGTGTGSMAYQMFKVRAIEGVAGASYQKITRPVGPTFDATLGNTVSIFWNDIEVPQGSAPGTCSIDDSTGVVLFIPYQHEVIEIAGDQVIFAGTHNLTEGDWLTLDGFGGVMADNNDQVVQIVGIISDTAVQVGVVLVSGEGAGTASHLPGQTDTLTWTGLYDYPARFDIDSFDNVAEAFIEDGQDLAPKDVWVRLNPIPLVQLRE